jgi:hypothetical protein
MCLPEIYCRLSDVKQTQQATQFIHKSQIQTRGSSYTNNDNLKDDSQAKSLKIEAAFV